MPGREQKASSRRIAYVLDTFPSFSETFVLREMLELEKMGWKVSIFALNSPGVVVSHPGAQRLQAQTCYLDRAAASPLRSAAAMAFAWFRNPLRVLAALRLARSLGAPYAWIMRHAYWLAHRIAASGSSHIHVHFGGPAAQWAMCASALNGVPYSFVAHRYEVYERPPPRFDTLVRRARFCVTVSQANVRQLNRMLGQLSSKFELIPNGTDTSFFCPDRNVPREPGLVVSVGRLSPQKAFQDLIEAAAIVRDRSSSFHMVIIGEGPERQRLEALIAARHLGSRVTLAGARDALFVRDRLRRAEVFALSSISESFGVVYLEAMATETPVVGTGVQGVPEVVAEGVTGFLVPPGAPEAMAERIAKLLGDPDLRGRMGRAGRQRVCKEFSITEQAVRLSGLLTTGPV